MPKVMKNYVNIIVPDTFIPRVVLSSVAALLFMKDERATVSPGNEFNYLCDLDFPKWPEMQIYFLFIQNDSTCIGLIFQHLVQIIVPYTRGSRITDRFFTVPLHSPNDRHLPVVRAGQGNCQWPQKNVVNCHRLREPTIHYDWVNPKLYYISLSKKWKPNTPPIVKMPSNWVCETV